ncbi:camelysin. Metallo peptidase. MEROPS family M73 [Lentibacillus halodurans]|uniref:Camelysin. Metallo peptidase. MEROPS family M73 n=1 Tax=Lentibacillus halodurans TaxID=237679 RepID=A0A1I0Z4B0_9BACI|nr:TasA family protein [Lentibacillus halodurans]SFB19430.1 camelysin. Metallo peptidase. MEROPS family M73 [Lentibacillus halodurans]
MGIKKKLGIGLASAVLGISLIGGGTFAYFNDVEETNNTFAAGTLDLNLKGVDDKEDVDLHLENMKPGDWKVHQVRLYNDGSLTFKDVKLNTAYEINDVTGDNANEDFADHILVTIMDTGTNEVYERDVPVSELDEVVVSNNQSPGDRKILRMDFKFHDNGEDQNKFQGDSLNLDLTFEASQEDGELQ